MNARRFMSWLLTVTILLPILVSCTETGDGNLTKEIQNLASNGDLDARSQQEAIHLMVLHKKVQAALRNQPTLKALPKSGSQVNADRALKLHEFNAAEANAVISAQTSALKELADNIKKVSKMKYESGVSAKQIAEAQTITLMNLLSIRDLAQVGARKILMLMTKFDKSYFDDIPANEEMKKKLLAEYTSSLAIAAVSANDLRVTLKELQEMREEKILEKSLEKSINRMVKRFGGAEHEKKEQLQSFMKENVTDKAQSALSQAFTEYHQSLEGKSLLYNPAQLDHPLVHILVIVSNLSWGLVNTLVGLGFVITAAILAPITTVGAAAVRAFGYEPLFYEIRLPRLAIADNNMQIYADVCGLGIVPGKMSAGLFELDFCSGKSFASDHEGGHAKQSAILGPLYFPAAILSYILNLGHGGFIEEWADAWAVS